MLLKNIICGINQRQGVLVKFQVDNATLIINRTGCAVLYSLGHIIDINIVAKNLTGIAVLCGDGRTGKADKGCIRKGIVDNPSVADHSMCFFLAILIFGHYDFLIESILPAMRFIGHHNDISPLGQWLLATFKLEHGCKDDPIGIAPIQK